LGTVADKEVLPLAGGMAALHSIETEAITTLRTAQVTTTTRQIVHFPPFLSGSLCRVKIPLDTHIGIMLPGIRR
jgi:hypothetical protein